MYSITLEQIYAIYDLLNLVQATIFLCQLARAGISFYSIFEDVGNRLTFYLFDFIVKDKAEILLQVDESQSIKNELTLQVNISMAFYIYCCKLASQNNCWKNSEEVLFVEQDLPA